MITAKNYAAQAEKGLRQFADKLELKGFKHDSISANFMASSIKHCVHFAMPDGGRIFDDKLRGIKGEIVRLPFKQITIEYFNEKFKEGMFNGKKIILAIEVESDNEILSMLGCAHNYKDEHVILVFAAANTTSNEWFMCATGYCLQCSWDYYDDNVVDIGKGELSFVGKPFAAMPECYKKAKNESSSASFFEDAVSDIVRESRVVLELCEALTCRNVSSVPIEKINQSKNVRRIKNGKLPLYETRMLVVDTSLKSNQKSLSSSLSDRNSPRQHLRRGHIRRLNDDRKIWVNSCVVGDKQNGIVNKNYSVV